MSSAGQLLLRNAAHYVGQHVAGTIIVEGSGGKGRPTLTPWVGFFDPKETTSPEEGLYVVYLFSSDLQRVVLSLIQGITKLSKELGPKAARKKLAEDANAIRESLTKQAPTGWDQPFDLGPSGFRQQAYAAGNVFARKYSLQDLPPEAKLLEDLETSLSLYRLAIEAKVRLSR